MRAFATPLAAAYLLALSVASAMFADRSWKSVTGYRSEYALDRHFEAGPPLSGQVAIVILDGLRVDRAAELPAFGELVARGASGILRVPLPSLSNPARAAIVTGAWPEVSGVTNNSQFESPPVQSLIGLARRRGEEVAVFGTGFWPKAFPDDLGGRYRGYGTEPASGGAADLADWQARGCDEAQAFLAESAAALAVVGLLAGDEAGHNHGGASKAYAAVTAAVDACLGRIVRALGAGATVIAVSDHGHIDRWGSGGHGGNEPEVLNAPFALAGPGIRHQSGIHARIVDLAPTASVLLGLPIPANSQGQVLWEALEVPAESEGRLRALERSQRDALAAHMPDRESSRAAQRRGRLPSALASTAWFLFVAVVALRRQPLPVYAAASAAFAALFFVLFFAFQLGPSISDVVRQEYLNWFFLRLIAAAALAFVGASLLLRRLAGGTAATLPLAATLTSAIALLVTFTHYVHGLRMEGWMIEIGPGFKAYLELLAIIGVALGAALVAAAGRISRIARK